MDDIKWIEHKIKIADIKAYEHNPRQITSKRYELLVKAIKENGYNNRLLLNEDNIVIGGHQRLSALQDAGMQPADEISVLKPNRKLTDKEFQRINIQDNISFGEWDMDILTSAFEIDDIVDWGIDEDVFKDLAHSEQAFAESKEKGKEKEKFACPNCGFQE